MSQENEYPHGDTPHGSHFKSESRFSRDDEGNVQHDETPGQDAGYEDWRAPVTFTSEEDGYVPYSGYYAPGAQVHDRVMQGNAPLRVEPKRSGGNAGAVVIAILVLGLIFGSAVWMWFNRNVRVSVNGVAMEVRYRSTLDEVLESSEAEVVPGNLVSVGGSVLEEGSGWAYAAEVNGAALDNDQVAEYRVSGNETITFADGADKMEDYTSENVTVQPKLTYEGEVWAPIQYVAQWGQVGEVEMRTGAISGETAQGDVITEVKDVIIQRVYPKASDGRRLVCLTFDDGPSPVYTSQYLDILNEYGIKATFCELGVEVADQASYSQLVADSGCQIVSHTYNHLDLPTLDADEVYSEITTSYDAIKSASGVTTTATRPPYGDFGDACWLASRGSVSVLVTWTQDSEDWEQSGVDDIVEKALESVTNGSIILMHDGGGNRAQDLQALPQIIERLQDQGFEFVTLSELLDADDSIPDDVAACTATMPEGSVWPTEVASTEEASE